MKMLTARLKSASPYSQSKHYKAEEMQGESKDDYAMRTWRNYMHADKDGNVFIPPGAFKNCLSEAAKFMSIPVPGKGKATYTKNFEAGVLVVKGPYLGLKVDDAVNEALFLPADGRRGSGKRVMKYYPLISEWEADVEFVIVDETVLQSSVKDKSRTVFQDVLEGAGQFIGIGRFRPRQNGYYGRFDVISIKGV